MAHIEVVVPGADDSNKHLVVPPTPDWDKRDCALAHAQSKVSALFLLPHSIRAASLANPPSRISLTPLYMHHVALLNSVSISFSARLFTTYSPIYHRQLI